MKAAIKSSPKIKAGIIAIFYLTQNKVFFYNKRERYIDSSDTNYKGNNDFLLKKSLRKFLEKTIIIPSVIAEQKSVFRRCNQ
jgi:hypothetical protein